MSGRVVVLVIGIEVVRTMFVVIVMMSVARTSPRNLHLSMQRSRSRTHSNPATHRQPTGISDLILALTVRCSLRAVSVIPNIFSDLHSPSSSLAMSLPKVSRALPLVLRARVPQTRRFVRFSNHLFVLSRSPATCPTLSCAIGEARCGCGLRGTTDAGEDADTDARLVFLSICCTRDPAIGWRAP